MTDIYLEIGKTVVSLLTQKGVIDHKYLRNEFIRARNAELKENGISYEERIKILSSETYSTPKGETYCIGEKAIEKILNDKSYIVHRSNIRKKL